MSTWSPEKSKVSHAEIAQLEALVSSFPTTPEPTAPDECKNPDSWSHDCHNDYWQVIEADGIIKGRRCPCFNGVRIQNAHERFTAEIPSSIKIDSHENRKYQLPAIEVLFPKIIGDHIDLPHRGAWIYGVTRYGKTHLAYKAISRFLEFSRRPLRYFVTSAKKLIQLWVDQYKEDRVKARREIERMFKADILFFDDIDKLKMSPAREAEIFDLLNQLFEKSKLVYFTAQVSIRDFCQRMEDEAAEAAINGKGPRESRLESLCHEICVMKDAQMKLGEE